MFWPFVAYALAVPYATLQEHSLYRKLAQARAGAFLLRTQELLPGPAQATWAAQLPSGAKLSPCGAFFVFENINCLFYGAHYVMMLCGSADARRAAMLGACLRKMEGTVDMMDTQDLLQQLRV